MRKVVVKMEAQLKRLFILKMRVWIGSMMRGCVRIWFVKMGVVQIRPNRKRALRKGFSHSRIIEDMVTQKSPNENKVTTEGSNETRVLVRKGQVSTWEVSKLQV